MMSLNDILGKIINHEMLVEEANHVKNLSKGSTSSRKQVIALKASKNKQIVIEISSEEEEEEDEDNEYDEDEMTLFIKKFNNI
jgi:hypothetical protein